MSELKQRRATSKDGQEYTVNEVYRDAAGGIWYGFEDPLRMPAQRALAGEIAATWADLNMTKEDLRDYLRRQREYANKGNIVDLFRVVSVMEERLEWAADGETLLNLAKVYFILDDEPILEASSTWQNKKQKRFDEDSACKGFFLHRAFMLTKGYSEFSQSDIVAYLEAAKHALSRFEERDAEQPKPSAARQK